MLLLRKPSEAQIRQFLLSQSDQTFSYKEVGMTRSRPPSGYNADHNMVELLIFEKLMSRFLPVCHA